jgi:hypothetical protein
LALYYFLLFFACLIFVFILIHETNKSLPYHYPYHYHNYDKAFAHMPVSNSSRVQEWTDSYNGISIQFVYEPERPIIDTFTELKFSILNTTTGSHISDTDDVKARVVVTNGQRLFKFENVSVGNDGHFSVKYIFPDDGTHQAITRLDMNDSSSASSFNVFVPHQAPPSILNPFPSSTTTTSPDNNQRISNITIILVGIIGSIAVASIFQIKRKQRRPS